MNGPKPLDPGRIIPNQHNPNQFHLPVENLPGGGQIHETFKIDRHGNPFDGHTTVQVPGGGKKNINWP